MVLLLLYEFLSPVIEGLSAPTSSDKCRHRPHQFISLMNARCQLISSYSYFVFHSFELCSPWFGCGRFCKWEIIGFLALNSSKRSGWMQEAIEFYRILSSPKNFWNFRGSLRKFHETARVESSMVYFRMRSIISRLKYRLSAFDPFEMRPF